MPAHAWLGLAMIVVNLLAGLIGAFAWWRVEPSRLFWPLLRAGQLLVVLVAAHGGILYAQGVEIPDLHLIYGLMPIGIAFIAEQLRLTSAQAVLDQRGLEDSSAVAALSEREQKTIVLTIVRREIGVMAASALVITVLGLRAAEWL
ncbi:MAG: hypothetical protein AVDCRST_MAG69-2183 [uncultured Solirubrobacteraceae bacterium]|uniref:Uncharacterized protein n=1 Tax=uncultured Solirubrobacteraceae bacterium TaxID=1162706 RepID=A0A6J4SUF6_9ACTN|nr:MAG: hypothetical protein AVDCRST_MAG69-2183 [uncultured Solirubrobacteraceae bacterium]